MNILVNVIKKRREEIKMTKEEFAKKMGWSLATVDYYDELAENNTTITRPVTTVVKLANTLKLSFDELTGDDKYTKSTIESTNKFIQEEIPGKSIGEISDGYHTFNELYHHRALLFASLCDILPDLFWKSKKHEDGTMYDGMFIVGMKTHYGNATYHYDIDPYWDMFVCTELEYSPVFDGHTPADAIKRIKAECKIIGDKLEK